MPLATTTAQAALRDTETGGAACSPRTLAISQSTVGKHPTGTTHGMSVSRAPTVGFLLHDPASPGSEIERDTIIEDNVVNNTIPIVRGVVCNHTFTLIYTHTENNPSLLQLRRVLTHIFRRRETTLL
jgi:hypothetical protein